ncbi:UNVERIFIED_CONTAM: hypothetical protein RMT77_011239 [Armadillidium vulgare]
MNNLCLLTFALLVVATSARMAYVFPSGYEYITGEVRATFSCENRPYGYYADVDNFCRIFHICLPIPDENGNILDTYQYSFICGNQTIFNQETLTCDFPEYSFPCDQAASLYDLKNSEFGRIYYDDDKDDDNDDDRDFN